MTAIGYFQVWRYWIDEESKPKRLQHRTTLTRHTVARCSILKDDKLSWLMADSITSVCSLNDGSKRQKQDHGPLALTLTDTETCSVHAIVLPDSVTAGKKGNSQANHIFNSMPEAVRHKFKAMVYATTSSNTGSKAGLRAELQRKLRRKIMEMRCFQHVWSLVMVSFGIRLNGATPSLHTGSSTRPQPIAYLFFHAYVENRDAKEIKEAYELLWGKNYGTRQEPIWTRWKYVVTAAVQARSRWP